MPINGLRPYPDRTGRKNSGSKWKKYRKFQNKFTSNGYIYFLTEHVPVRKWHETGTYRDDSISETVCLPFERIRIQNLPITTQNQAYFVNSRTMTSSVSNRVLEEKYESIIVVTELLKNKNGVF